MGVLAYLSARHSQWNYQFMAASYWLALPATALILVGFVRALRHAFLDRDPGRRLAWLLVVTVLFVIGFAILYMTLALPFYSQAKAIYGLSAVIPLALVTALGLAALPEALAAPRLQLVRAVYYGWLGALAGVLVLSFLG